MRDQWWNDYVGLPYKAHGRDKNGLDCWGLVRLVHDEVFGTKLPSFVDAYTDERATIEEAIAQRREGWRRVDVATAGDVVLFRVLGALSHVGVITTPGHFLHAMEGRNTTIERLSSPEWEKRVEGIYRYSPAGSALVVSAAPHPLRTARIDTEIGAGLSVAQMVAELRRQAGVSSELEFNGVVWIDGLPVPRAEWETLIPAPGSRVEFRALAGKGVGRILLTIAVVVAAWYFAPMVAGALGVSTTAGSLGLTLTTAALTVAGTLLVNAIFPVRPPEQRGGIQAPNSMPLLLGGRNEQRQYGAIPVILGRHRFTPPLGAVPYTESGANISRLRLILVWGYGPVQVSDLRIGDTPIDTLEEVEYETLTGYQDTAEQRSRFDGLYGRDVSQDVINIKLESDGTSGGSPWVERVISDECDRISVTLHFPEGLRQMPVEGSNAGKVDPAFFRGSVQVRQLDSSTLAPITGWGNAEREIFAQSFNVQPAWFNIDTDEELEPVYRWVRFSLDEYCKIVTRYGAFTTNPAANPTGNILRLQQEAAFGVGMTYDRLPAYGPGEEGLWDVCVLGNSVHQIVDRRDSSVTGCALTMTGLTASIAAGTIQRAYSDTVRLGANGEPYNRRKDAFSYNVAFNVPKGVYEVRVRRTNTSESDFVYPSGNKGRRYHDCILLTITGYENRKPVTPPRPLAMTAIRVKATNQINGQLEGITGTVQSLCLDYAGISTGWVLRATRNPASLFRCVLQHPANAQRVADSAIDLDALADWHNFCRVNKFMFDGVLSEQRALWDVLMDIAAAGRASPLRKDGKWSVVIDRPRTHIAQHFTPHNSWGFESLRSMPKLPHAFRVQFSNARKGYQPDERIVYNDGYSAANATLFEGLVLPGVTDQDLIFKHGRFHLAQMKLRPETYTLYADIEHLVCNRGDLVRVTHDVPMWGLGTGRIKNRVSGTVLELDELVPMKAGVQYTIRIRLESGGSITRTVAAAATDGEYSTITLTTSVTTAQGAPGNLFLFGELGEESVELIVTSIEPAENMSARITLVDYSPAVYTSDTEEIPAFDSQITRPPRLLQETIAERPTISRMISDESVTTYLGPGQYGYNLRVAFTNPATLPDRVKTVEGQIDFAGDSAFDWQRSIQVLVGAGALTFDDVEEGEPYRVRLRYVDENGRFGPWRTSGAHTIAGRTNPPATVTGLSTSIVDTQIELRWSPNGEIDIVAYEVRLADTGWGDTGFLFRGATASCLVAPPPVGQSRTWFIRALDAAGNYSTTSATTTFTTAALPNPASITEDFFDTSTTSATVTLDWPDVLPQFGLRHYRVSYPGVVKFVNASTITLPANWIGNRTFTVQAVDQAGNTGTGTSKTITKLAPSSPTGLRAQVIDNTVMLYWTVGMPTTLPVSHTLLKKGTSWATAEVLGRKDGAFTTINELQGGNFRYWLATVDTDGYESTPVSINAIVSQPPDFVFQGERISTLNGTRTSAIFENGAILLPANTTETWAQHFTSRSWSTPQDQINAGFPIYLQPTPGSGSYQETFDFGNIVASSRAVVNFNGDTVAGSPIVTPRIELSDDNTNWVLYDGVTEAFGTNFRYVRFRLTVTQSGTQAAIYRLNALECNLSTKLKSDAGNVFANSADASGTVANFNTEFIDADSINVTANSTTPVIPVYNFKDAVLSGTYSISAGVATVNVTAHDLVVGQRVKLNFTTGAGVPLVATVASVISANSFTAAVSQPNTSGNVSIYWQGLRIYLFNTAGARVSGDASWQVRGY